MQFHEQLLRLRTVAAEYDLLDLCNLAWAELAFRHCQAIAWTYIGRLREQDAGKGGGKGQLGLAPEELTAFAGVSKAGDLVMVAPSLLEHAKGVVEKDASILKHIRVARQERQARKTGKPPDKEDIHHPLRLGFLLSGLARPHRPISVPVESDAFEESGLPGSQQGSLPASCFYAVLVLHRQDWFVPLRGPPFGAQGTHW